MLLPNQLVANHDHLRGFGFVTWEYPIWAQLGIIDEHVIFMFIYVVYRLYLSIIDYLSVFNVLWKTLWNRQNNEE